MSDAAAFLQAIAESPDDDAPRLVFADWLDEYGDAARAEFIRVQCEAATLPRNYPRRDRLEQRANELLQGHRQRWDAGIAERPHETKYYRGFVDSIRIDAFDWEWRLPALAAVRPHLRMDVVDAVPETVGIVATMPELLNVRRLCLSPYWGSPGDPLTVLLHSPYLTTLTELDMRDLNPDRFPTSLTAWPGLVGVRKLAVTWVGLRAVLRSPHVPRLRSLRLIDAGEFDPDAMETLADWPGLEHLEELDLENLDDNALRTLANSGRASRLRRLTVSSDHVSPAGSLTVLASGLPALRDVEFRQGIEKLKHATLASAPSGPGVGEPLTRLDVAGYPLGDVGATWLARAPRLAEVSVLCLRDCGIGVAGIRALAASPHLSELKALDVGRNPFGPQGVRALAESPHLTKLEFLGLEEVVPGVAGMQALARSPWVRSLRELRFGDCDLTPTEARMLAEIPFDPL